MARRLHKSPLISGADERVPEVSDFRGGLPAGGVIGRCPDRTAPQERWTMDLVRTDPGHERASGVWAVPTPGRHGGSSPKRPRTVLVVDDEPAIVELLALLFEDEGFDVVRAYDGEQGLRLAKSLHPDLIISDVSMPRLTGLDLVRRLRSNGTREVPVILMSAVVCDVAAERCVFVPKPFDLERMLALAEAQMAPR